jgi:dipeptidyl aminopeptidase/acylaminoacyl peptidase
MRLFLPLTAALLLAVPATGAPPESPPTAFEGRDLFALQQATDPQIRPDGGAVAYVRVGFEILTDRSRRSIWSIDLATGEESPLIAGAGTHGAPRWSPDGRRLAFISTVEGKRPQLFVRWMESGAVAQLAELTAAPNDLAWSADGRWIAFTMFAPDEKPKLGEAPPKPEGAEWAPPLQVISDITYRADGAGPLEPGYTHVYVVPASGGAPRQLTFGAFNESGPISWTPDGRHLLVSGNRHPDWRRQPLESEIYEVALADGTIRALTARRGPDAEPLVSPDGRAIAFLGFEDRMLSYQNARLQVMDRDGGAARSLTDALDRTIDQARWAADGRSLIVRYDDRGITRLARVTLDGRLAPVAQGLSGAALDRPYTGGAFSVARDGTVALTLGSPQRPSEIAVVRDGRVRQLTRLNEQLEGKRLGEVRPLPVTSSFDGRPIDAWIVTPPDYDPAKRYPLILEIHGGPFAAYGPIFATDLQLYAAAGYAVLYANPRGSTSYGEEFAQFIHHRYPSEDYDDLISAVDAAIAAGVADPENLFVTGGSGGGVLTAWIVGKTDRFRAAATQKPVINWTSTALTTDIYTFMPKYWFEKLPWEDPEAYWKVSPLSLVGNVKTPTLVVVGDQDLRTPVADSEQYYQALQLRGVPTALVKVPGASHSGLTARPSQSAAKASAILAWFERYRLKQ